MVCSIEMLHCINKRCHIDMLCSIDMLCPIEMKLNCGRRKIILVHRLDKQTTAIVVRLSFHELLSAIVSLS